MTTTERVHHLDQMLTGLALFETYTSDDTDMRDALLNTVPSEEAVLGLLAAMETMTNVFAAQARLDSTTVVDTIRRRIIREIGRTPAA